MTSSGWLSFLVLGSDDPGRAAFLQQPTLLHRPPATLLPNSLRLKITVGCVDASVMASARDDETWRVVGCCDVKTQKCGQERKNAPGTKECRRFFTRVVACE